MAYFAEILLVALIIAILVLLFWERFNTHKLIQKQIELAEGVSKTFQKDAEVRGKELTDSHHILYRVMEDAKEERAKYMDNIQVFADRFMSWGDLQKFALMNFKQTQEAPTGYKMDSAEEARIEKINQLQQAGYTQEEAIEFMRAAEEAPIIPGSMDYRRQQVQEEILEGEQLGSSDNIQTAAESA